MTTRAHWRDLRNVIVAVAVLAALTWISRAWWHHTNPTTAALVFLLVVLVVATTSQVWAAMAAAVLADLCLNYFFMPPFGTLTIADPENWVALIVFLAVSFVASSLSAAARDRALARQSEEVKSALLASLGHNLRTPLTAIRVAAGNLQTPGLGEDDQREQCDLIRTEVDRLNRLFENVLDMARVDAGAVTAELQWIGPMSVYDAARDQVGPLLDGREVRVTCETDDPIRLDPRLTASALAHILENAAQYSPADRPIDVTLAVTDDEYVVRVRDHGPGIAAEDRPHVFERFYRGTGAVRRPSGTGMGLSIARGLLAVEGGRITVETPADGGTTFTIHVPAQRKGAADTDAED
jgi:two-component system, OmpR family, sensor histidine kinase KdpD